MNKKIKITKIQLNEVKERLVEEQIENVIKLPNFILNSIKDGRTSLGKHPSFPPEDEKRFEEKILLKRFMELGKSLAKISDLQQHDKQTLTNKLSEYVRKAIIIETPLRKELEKLCYDFVCGQFDLTPGELDITCELKDRIEPENLPNVEPMLLDDTEFDDISSIDNLGKEIYKRRLINSLIQGASVRLSSEFNKIVSDLYELNPSLIELYHNILIINEYLSFIKEVKPDNKNLGGFVSVDLSNPEPKISSEAVIFPVLVFETVKGIMELVASHGLPKNRREAEYVIGKADFSLAENWDKRFGVGLYDLFVKNIQNKKLQTEVFAELVELEPERFFIKTKEVFANTKKGKEFITNLEKYITRGRGFDDIDKAIGVNNNDFNTFDVNTGGNDTDFYFEREDFNLGVDDGGYYHVDELGGLITDSVTTTSAGDYTYDVPLFGDEETLNHKDMIKNGQMKWNVRENIEHVLDKENDEYSEIHDIYKIIDYNKVHRDFLTIVPIALKIFKENVSIWNDIKVVYVSKIGGGALGRFKSGTSSSTPIIMVSEKNILNACKKYHVDLDTAIKTTLYHELGHAICELEYDLYGYQYLEYGSEEDWAEDFAYNLFEYDSISEDLVTFISNLKKDGNFSEAPTINEMAYPTSFNMEEFKKIRSFAGRVAYCRKHLNRIAEGSSRMVFKIDDEKVLKLAKNRKGLGQNESEARMGYSEGYFTCIAHVFDYDDNYMFVEMELAKKCSKQDFLRITGYDFETFVKYLQAESNGDLRKEFSQEFIDEAYDNSSIMTEVSEFVRTYELPLGDIYRLEHYGIVKRKGEEYVVLIDYGLTNDVYEKYY